jgi:hypothetical protein
MTQDAPNQAAGGLPRPSPFRHYFGCSAGASSVIWGRSCNRCRTRKKGMTTQILTFELLGLDPDRPAQG